MDIDQINCLLAVLDTGDYSEAGERLHFSQSTVSKKIIGLENEFGVKLIEKNGRHFLLSAYGKKVVAHFVDIKKSHTQILDAIDSLRCAEKAGSHLVRIAAGPAMVRYNIIALTNAFAKKYPDTDIIIDEIENSYILSLLQKGIFDIAFCEDIDMDAKHFDAQSVAHEKFMLAVPFSSRFSSKDAVDLAELRDERFIFHKTKLYDLCVESCIAAGFRPNVFFATTRPEIAFQHIKEGTRCVFMGLRRTLLSIAPEYCKILAINDSPEFNFVFAWKKNPGLFDAAKLFLDFASRYPSV